MSKGLTSVVAMQDGGFFGDPGDSPEAYSPSSFGGPSGPEAAAGGPSPFDNSSSESSEPKRSVNVEDFIGSGDEDEDQMVQQILATPEEDRNWVEKRIAAQYEEDPSKLGEVFYDPRRAAATGYMSEATIPGLSTGLASLFGTPMVYTGFGASPFGTGIAGGGDDRRPQITSPTTGQPVAVEPEVSVPPSYYATGAGTGTVSLSEFANIQPYLSSLYGTTPSPISQNYEELVRRIKKQEKDRRRLSGLDIFKPVSTVT